MARAIGKRVRNELISMADARIRGNDENERHGRAFSKSFQGG